MKRFLPTLYILCAAALLSGCRGGNVFSSHRDMERLRLVQTFGLDGGGQGVTVSVSTGVGLNDAPPLVMTASGAHIETAVQRLQDCSPEDELFYAHVRYILLGEDTANGNVERLLEWVERSPAMRMETPLLLVRGRAAEAVAGTTGEHADITERLASLEREEQTRGRHIHTLREIAAALTERGCALCAAVCALPADGTVITASEAEADALIPDGWAVLRADGPPVFLPEGETLAAELLTGGVRGARVSAGAYVLDIIRGEASITEQRDEAGVLEGLSVRCELHAGVLEGPRGAADDACAVLAAETEAWLGAVIGRSQHMACDFLGLEDALHGRKIFTSRKNDEAWEALFPSLPVDIAVEAQIDQSYDLAQEVP